MGENVKVIASHLSFSESFTNQKKNPQFVFCRGNYKEHLARKARPALCEIMGTSPEHPRGVMRGSRPEAKAHRAH
ncbi:hypothetical protein SKAU_G00388170 [Synaphobranchus kaupii]|uniref:Uncharacterized protein n=1 Tax=Synaphobranchus kaupii TaxID=118154 RepID=A0A9Q1ICI5_SYNKA|nr:hypothetical protein SKAU_G00388170 [Synaphobranchus kaupii]